MSNPFFRTCVLVFTLVAGTHCATGQVSTGPLGLEPAFPELSFERPVDLQHAGDDSNRLFVVEQRGVIRVFENTPTVEEAAVFLDIQDRVNDSGNEEGLLGLAFHPNFEENGYFYVDYTADDPRRTVIARYQVDPQNPDRADPNSEAVLLEIPQPYANHNGGQIAFGPDGYLYIAMGDGGSGGDPEENGQDTSTLLGAILRIDVDTPSGGRPYGIPADNPFAGNTEGARGEIYAYGLRNPWRFSFDPNTGQLWTGDVGQNAYEEIDIIEKGENYGWDVMEGTHCFEPEEGCDRTGLAEPVWEYGREDGISVTGGFVYRGQRAPELAGRYVFADYGSGKVWSLDYDGSSPASVTELMDSGLAISSFGVDQHQELYALAFDGQIYHFTPRGGSN